MPKTISILDYFPLEIHVEIMKRLPIKSLIRLRSVSKQWKSLINTSDFIAKYHVNNTMSQHHLLVLHADFGEKYVSIVNDDATFPNDKFSPTVPNLDNKVITGSSHGLLCFYSYYRNENDNGRKITVVIWNPSIRKSVAIDLPNVYMFPYETVVGFGVCPGTSDPKLVKITCNTACQCQSCTCSQVEAQVFTLRSGVWRTISINLTCKSIAVTKSSVAVDEFIYWLAFERVNRADCENQWNKLILSFDMTSENFSEINIPNSLASDRHVGCSISKLKESLVLLEYNKKHENRVYSVWIMDHGVSKSFTKLFTINTPGALIEDVFGFRNSGEPIIGLREGLEEKLFVYEPDSNHKSFIGISGNPWHLFTVSSYIETLLLIDQ